MEDFEKAFNDLKQKTCLSNIERAFENERIEEEYNDIMDEIDPFG